MPRNNPLSIVSYYGAQERSHCGYCKKSDGSHSHGMQAHILTANDYQDLIDRGWRRSGQYCYKPTNTTTCCPSYTIKCDAVNFKLSKSQKKVIKKVNKFLRDGVKEKSTIDGHQNISVASTSAMQTDQNTVSNDTEQQLHETLSTMSTQKQINVMEIQQTILNEFSSQQMEANFNKTNDEQVTENRHSFDDAENLLVKPQRKKAKILRMERRMEKLAKQSDAPKATQKPSAKFQQNSEKTLSQLIDDVPADSRHKLQVKLLHSEQSNETNDVFEVYKKFQIHVHKDPPHKTRKSGFENFLVRTPLEVKLIPIIGNGQEIYSGQSEEFILYCKYQSIVHKDVDAKDFDDYASFLVSTPIEYERVSADVEYGSFHAQYWLDDDQLIAVGVIDVLPHCISSVYFFYDPDYSFLSLGTYGSLRELLLVQQLQQKIEILKYYYMGFYIHECPKMRYKAKLSHSYLLCPETYTWHLYDETISNLLTTCKYQRFNMDLNAIDCDRIVQIGELDQMKVLINLSSIIRFRQFAERASTATKLKYLLYGQLIGRILSERIVLCIQ